MKKLVISISNSPFISPELFEKFIAQKFAQKVFEYLLIQLNKIALIYDLRDLS